MLQNLHTHLLNLKQMSQKMSCIPVFKFNTINCCFICCFFVLLQPLCDGSHKFIARYLGSNHTRYYPVTFEVEKNGTYWMCNCKQTGNRPFCDGTHRSDDIQKKYKK